jgi:hypothetical protein
LILNDQSNSMSLLVENTPKTEIVAPFQSELRRIAEHYDYSVQNINLFTSNPSQSFLIEELRDILHSGLDIRGIALASDGWFSDDPALFRQLIIIPIYTFNPEIVTENPKILIDEIRYSMNARLNEVIPIRVNFTSENIDGDLSIKLLHNDRVLQAKNLSVTSENQSNQIILDTTLTETGLNVFQIIITCPYEVATDSGFSAIQVVEDKSRIMILTDIFTWDIRTFNRTLNYGDRFDTELFYVVNGNLTQRGLGVSVNWSDFDGFIIFNHGYLQLNSAILNTINGMILNGAGLIFMGNHSTQFETVLPSRQTAIRISAEGHVRLNPVALTFQIFRDIEESFPRFPPVQFYYLTAREQATVIAEVHDHQMMPVILLGNHGLGDVLHIVFHGLWRWQLSTSRDIFDRFIAGLGQWIFGDATDNFFAFTDKNIFYTGERITVRLSAFDERLNPLRALNARLTLYDELNQIVFSDFLVRTDDLHAITMPVLEQGHFRYTVYCDLNQRETSGEFEILEESIQSRNRGFNHRLLSELSSASSGNNLTISELANLSMDRVETIIRTRYIEIPLYRNIFMIVIFLFSFCLELYLRKKWNLL